MRLEDFEKKVFEEFMGHYSRGTSDTVPEDHFLDTLNIDYEEGEWRTRAGLSPAINLGYASGKVRRFASFVDPALGSIVLILDESGNLYTYSNRPGDDASVPRISAGNLATDFSAIKILGKIYISFHDGEFGSTSNNLKVFIPGLTIALDEIRDAAGLAPQAVFPISAADGAAGLVRVGIYKIAVAFITSSGFITQPGPKIGGIFTPTTYNAPGSKKIDLTIIPVGPAGTTARQILITKSGLDEYFFLPSEFGGVINNNTSTTTTLNFDDITDLIDSADYLFDQLEIIPSPLVLSEYNSRMVLGGETLNPSILRVSRPGEPESFDTIDGVYNVTKDDGFLIRNLFVMRTTLYVFKNLGIWSVNDNGDVASTWNKPGKVDQTINVGVHGIAEFFDISSLRLSRDWTLLADRSGILLFDGVARKPSITYKINDIWQLINFDNFHKIVIVVDEQNHKIYCAVPINSSTDNNLLLVGNYSMCPGSIPESKYIKWSIWRFNLCGSIKNPTEIGLFGVRPDTTPTLKIGSLDGGGKIWRLDPNNSTDDGSDIESYFETSKLFWTPGYVHFFTALRLRIIGSGEILCSIKGLDNILTANIPTISLSSAGSKFITESGTGINGINNTFLMCTLTGFVGVFQNGLLIRNGVDYVRVGSTITMTAPPITGDYLEFLRIKTATINVTTNDQTSNVNGINALFTLPSTPFNSSSVLCFQNGLLIRNGIDFIVSGAIITMSSIPLVGDTLQFIYSTNAAIIIEILSGDGTNSIFNLANYPFESVLVFHNGLLVTTNYILNLIDKTITINPAPVPGDVIQIVYFIGSSLGTGVEKLVRFNFQNEKASIRCRSIAGKFIISKAEIYGKPVYQMRPS